jgi:tetratricopeptide (TPR) repeat protein
MSNSLADDDAPVKNTLTPNADEIPSSLRLDPSEEQELVEKSNSLKTSANALFTSSSYTEAITGYTRAIDTLPTYLDYELAVLKSNISACHVKLGEWKDAVEAATQALDSLERLDPVPVKKVEDRGEGEKAKLEESKATESAVVEEVDDQTAERYEALQRSGKSIDDVRKIRIKALLRRAKARSEQDSWANLQGAQEGIYTPLANSILLHLTTTSDYQALSQMPTLTPLDRKTVQTALRSLPSKLDAAKEKEMADMMGKLKQLGNGILKPFGFSTDNFSMVKDEKTGGYSLGFNQGK